MEEILPPMIKCCECKFAKPYFDSSKYGWLSEQALEYYEEQTEQFRSEEVEKDTEE